MKKYDPNRDYCGPEGMGISKWIPRTLWGVDINDCCFAHDAGWDDGEGHKRADKAFRKSIHAKFAAAGMPARGWFVKWMYYCAVRIGRSVLWLKGVR